MSGLRFGALMLGYNQEEYISYALRSVSPHVEEIVVLKSELPWNAYNPKARQQFYVPDSTGVLLCHASRHLKNVRVVNGEWPNEEEMRNDGLALLRMLKVDVCLIVDADEFYPEGQLGKLRQFIDAHSHPGAVFWARHQDCFRRFDYVVDADLRLPVAVHIVESTRFVNLRVPSGPWCLLPRSIFYWHMGYVMGDRRMYEKIHTFGHSHELAPGWFQYKWLKWTPKTIDLCRKIPFRWPRTVKIDLQELPTVLHTHPFFRIAETVRPSEVSDASNPCD